MTSREPYSLTFRNLLTFEINFCKGGHHAVRAEGILLQLLGLQGWAPAPQGDMQGLEARHYPQCPRPQGAGEGVLTSPLTAICCAGPSAVPSSVPDLRMLGGNFGRRRRDLKTIAYLRRSTETEQWHLFEGRESPFSSGYSKNTLSVSYRSGLFVLKQQNHHIVARLGPCPWARCDRMGLLSDGQASEGCFPCISDEVMGPFPALGQLWEPLRAHAQSGVPSSPRLAPLSLLPGHQRHPSPQPSEHQENPRTWALASTWVSGVLKSLLAKPVRTRPQTQLWDGGSFLAQEKPGQ